MTKPATVWLSLVLGRGVPVCHLHPVATAREAMVLPSINTSRAYHISTVGFALRGLQLCLILDPTVALHNRRHNEVYGGHKP